MIVKTCTQCGEQQREKLTWCAAAWLKSDLTRLAYRHKLCLTCVSAKIVPLQNHSDQQGMTCPACGIDTSTDWDAVYLSWIANGFGKLQAECPFCAPCAAIFRIWFQTGAEQLVDREPLSRGQEAAPRYTANETLAALGIQPRG